MFRDILNSRWFTAGALIVVGFLVISLLKIEPALVDVNREVSNLDKKIAEVKKSASEADRLGSYINSDAYFERQARLKLNYKKPDEKVVYVYNAPGPIKKSDEGADQLEILDSKLVSNLKLWWNYLTE